MAGARSTPAGTPSPAMHWAAVTAASLAAATPPAGLLAMDVAPQAEQATSAADGGSNGDGVLYACEYFLACIALGGIERQRQRHNKYMRVQRGSGDEGLLAQSAYAGSAGNRTRSHQQHGSESIEAYGHRKPLCRQHGDVFMPVARYGRDLGRSRKSVSA